MSTMTTLELVGISEIADMLQIKRQSVSVLRLRGRLPREDYYVSGSPIWHRETILEWMAQRPRKRYGKETLR